MSRDLENERKLLKESLIAALRSLKEIAYHRGDDTISGQWATELAYESIKEIEEILNG